MSRACLLRVEELCVAYGAIPAVRKVELEVAPGEIVAVIGRNGAGKTTILQAIAGMTPIESGLITFDSRPISHRPAHARVRAGLILVPQGRRLFPESTVAMNLWSGAFARRRPIAFQTELQRVLELFPGLRQRLDQRAGVLSGGEQQMVAIGRALMASPRLLLLDEPSMGLAPAIASRIFDALRVLASTGVTLLIAEQNVRWVMQLASRVEVLEGGRLGRHEGKPVRDIIAELLGTLQ